jgi:3-hydroxybutyryl-CoA dehydratase
MENKIIEKFEIIVTQNMINDYAFASKDFNPIHIDKNFAEKSIFKKRIAHGMLTLSLIMEYLYEIYSKFWFDNSSFEARFKNPLFAEEKIIISHIEKNISENKKNIKVKCIKENGDEVVTASLTIS